MKNEKTRGIFFYASEGIYKGFAVINMSRMKRKFCIFLILIIVLSFYLEDISTTENNISEEKHTILYDGYHSLHGETAYSTFNSKLPDRFTVEYTYEPLTREKIFNFDILLISDSIRAFSEEEISNIEQFVEEGGGLLLMGQGWYWVAYHHKPIKEYPLNHIAQEFGVTVNDDNIIDPTNQTSEGLTIFTKFAAHPTTEGLKKVHSGAPSSLSITGDAVPIVMGDEDSYSTSPTLYGTGDYPPVAAALEYGTGKAVIIGTGILTDYTDHDTYDNIQFGINIFDWFSASEEHTILYDGYHSAQKEAFYSTFFSRLSTQFTIKCTYNSLTKENLFNCNILVISQPTKAYSEEEISNIKQFVEEGGGLLLMGNGWAWVDYDHKSIEDFPFNQIGREFGVSVNDDVITDPTDYHPSENPTFTVFSNFPPHPATEGLAEVYSLCACSLSITGDAIPIVMGDKDSYSGYIHSKPYKAGDYPPVAAALEYGKGRAIFLGHDCFIADVALDEYDNLQFGLNMVEWLSKLTIRFPDRDGDGYSPPEDCDDNDSNIYPGAQEPCGKDYNCDGQVTVCTGTLKIAITFEGEGLKANVYVDGSFEGVTDSQGNLIIPDLEADKEYTIRVEKEGYSTKEKIVNVEKDTTVQIEVEMEKKSPLIDILFAPIPVSVFSFIVTLIAFLMAFFKVDIETIKRIFSRKVIPAIDSGEKIKADTELKKELKFEYDIAISFAGENRDIAKHLAEKLRAKEVNIFYDEFYKSELWGKELTEYFQEAYGPKTRFVVVLMSEYYPVKDWTGFEFSIIRKEAEKRKTEFILPVKLDDTRMEGIKEDVAYLNYQNEGIDGIVTCLLKKLARSLEEEL